MVGSAWRVLISAQITQAIRLKQHIVLTTLRFRQERIPGERIRISVNPLSVTKSIDIPPRRCDATFMDRWAPMPVHCHCHPSFIVAKCRLISVTSFQSAYPTLAPISWVQSKVKGYSVSICGPLLNHKSSTGSSISSDLVV